MAIKHKIKDDKGNLVEVTLSPIKAIRRFCIECFCFQPTEIPKCTAEYCPLFPFRMGKTHRQISDKQRKRLSELSKERAKIKRG